MSFRAAPHTSGETAVKLKDYIEAGTVDAANSYEAWEMMKSSPQPLEVGDILETELGGIKICKYVGFEDAKWIVPEVKPAPEFPEAGPVPASSESVGKL